MAEDDIDLDALAAAESKSILSVEEIEGAKLEARKRVEDDARKAAKTAIIKAEMDRLNREYKPTGKEHLDETINVTIDLPEFATDVRVDMRPYWHGHTYAVPRAVAMSLLEQMQRAWNHQDDIDGKSIAQALGRRRVADPTTYAKGPGDPRFTFSAGQGAAA